MSSPSVKHVGPLLSAMPRIVKRNFCVVSVYLDVVPVPEVSHGKSPGRVPRCPLPAVTLEDFRNKLGAHEGQAELWLVYGADVLSELEAGRVSLVLLEAFFTRGEAYALAERLRQHRQWQHYYVFHVTADIAWALTNAPRAADYETAFGRARRLPPVSVTPAELAAAVQHTSD
jgi:hypothetical protein